MTTHLSSSVACCLFVLILYIRCICGILISFLVEIEPHIQRRKNNLWPLWIPSKGGFHWNQREMKRGTLLGTNDNRFYLSRFKPVITKTLYLFTACETQLSFFYYAQKIPQMPTLGTWWGHPVPETNWPQLSLSSKGKFCPRTNTHYQTLNQAKNNW